MNERVTGHGDAEPRRHGGTEASRSRLSASPRLPVSASTSAPSEREAIGATAAAWLAQRDAGLSPAETADFARWRAADPRHEAAVARLENAWSALQRLRDFRPEARMHPDRDLLAGARRSRRVVPFPAVAAAAALAASLAVAALWWSRAGERAPRIDEQRYATSVDGYQRVSLADGSVLELNSHSEVSVRFTAAERRLQLVRGEAHFAVAKNPARPFFVEAGAVAVRAVGTAFSVRLGATDVEVLVTEGKVELDRAAPSAGTSRAGAAAAPSGPATLAATPLVAGQRAVVAHRHIHAPVIQMLAPPALRQAVAWQSPRLVFTDTPLADAIARFNPHNQIQLELGDDELRSLPVGGSFRADNVEAFVRLITTDGELKAETVAPNRIVLRKAR